MKTIKRNIGELVVAQRVTDGYVNATQLCKAYEAQTRICKRPNHWFETDRANRLIELVSDVTGIPVTGLYSVVQGGNPTSQGTWIHPDLATPFASWLSVEYELMVSRWVQEWMKTGQNPIQKQTSSFSGEIKEATLEEIESLFTMLGRIGIKPALVESAKLTAVARSIPRLKIAAEEGKRLISSQMTLEEIPMSPTELGKILAQHLDWSAPLSPRKVNQALQNAGLQTSKRSVDSQGKTRVTWHLTEAGEKYGQLQMDTAQGHNKTVFCIRWFSSVISIIEELFMSKSA